MTGMTGMTEMSDRLSMRIAFVLAFAVAACGGRDPVRVAVDADTLIINSKLSVALPDRLVTADGGTVWSFNRTYVVEPASVASMPHDGAVQCAGDGDATVTVSSWGRRVRLTILCRPIASFFPFTQVRLVMGGPPVILNVGATGYDRRPVTLLAGTVLVRDTGVARYRDGRVFPVAIGKTNLDMDFSGMRDGVSVEVVENVAAALLRLAGGQLRSWRLPHGRYEIVLRSVDSTGPPTQLALATYKANCAPGRIGPGHIHCVTYDDGALIVRNPRPTGPRSERSGNILIVRRPW